MALPHRLPWSEFGWQVPPWATSAESPRDPFQYQTVVTESVAPLAFIRWHQRFDSLPKLIRNYTHSRHRPIVAGQRRPIRETRPRRARGLSHGIEHRPADADKIEQLKAALARTGLTFTDKDDVTRPSPLLAEIRSTTLVLVRCLAPIQMEPVKQTKDQNKVRAGQASWAARSTAANLRGAIAKG